MVEYSNHLHSRSLALGIFRICNLINEIRINSYFIHPDREGCPPMSGATPHFSASPGSPRRAAPPTFSRKNLNTPALDRAGIMPSCPGLESPPFRGSMPFGSATQPTGAGAFNRRHFSPAAGSRTESWRQHYDNQPLNVTKRAESTVDSLNSENKALFKSRRDEMTGSDLLFIFSDLAEFGQYSRSTASFVSDSTAICRSSTASGYQSRK